MNTKILSLIAFGLVWLPFTKASAETMSLSQSQLKIVSEFFGVAAPMCGHENDYCGSSRDCCGGYCDTSGRCRGGGRYSEEAAAEAGPAPLCVMSGGACRMNIDCCNSWCKIEQVCF